jgi:hypothetical protein
MTASRDLAEGRRLAWRRIRLLGRGARWLVILGVVLAMLALNVATLTMSGLNALASTALAAVTSVEPVAVRDRRAREAAEGALQEAGEELARARAETRDLQRGLDAAGDELRLARADAVELRRTRDAAEASLRANADELTRIMGEADRLRLTLDAREAERWVELGGRRVTVRDAVRRTTGAVRDRTARVATANIGSMAAESIPFYGIAVVVAATTFELASACQSMRDMRDLELALGVADAAGEDVAEVCGLRVPTAAEIGQMIRSSPGATWDGMSSALGEDNAPTRPNFDRRWRRTVNWFWSWFEE